jgi:hypothetical protein
MMRFYVWFSADVTLVYTVHHVTVGEDLTFQTKVIKYDILWSDS